ncbi:MAG TPA: glycoside hydrolase family 15 protein [Actinomycetales bacterium]|nr:glycoside hydrolase family 15 protein [Actinomycetales bacterium]
MAANIEDYALIGDMHTAALVSRRGSIDWLCLPRFDSPSTFGALLGTEDHGYWRLAPSSAEASSSRRYAGETFVLETTWETPDGVVEVTDAMPLGDRRADIVRRVRGVSGTVTMRQELAIRFGYAMAMPWVQRVDDGDGNEAILAVAGPDAVLLRGGPLPRPDDHRHVGEFDVAEGKVVDITLTWYPSHRPVPAAFDVDEALDSTRRWWDGWSDHSDCEGPYEWYVRRSLLVLRALTHEDTGGIVAAATTSLPEQFGGSRNWDYRYCWLRDAALTLEALLTHGYSGEAMDWRTWLLRAIAGDPEDVQIMYGLAGERDLLERELPQFPGYENSRPVRIGNGAVGQYQADVLGEVMIALENARQAGVTEDRFSWPLQRVLLDALTKNWQRPDHGIWEIRGPERHFTHSRVMVWAALDRGVRAVTEHGLEGPADRWAELRDRVRDEIEERGFDRSRGTYTQFYGGEGVDASLLQLAQVGYCEPDDERMLGTVAAIEEDLLRHGCVLRYRTEEGVDGLPPGEHPFLACSFWLVEQYARSGRLDDARELMDLLVGFSNDVGLLSEEYDVEGRRQVGNTPQAFSHLALVRAADALDDARRATLCR